MYRAIVLANRAGDEIMKAKDLGGFKRKAKEWVRKNIDVKPNVKERSSRFGLRSLKDNDDEPIEVRNLNTEVGQRLITEFFS